MTPAAWLAPLLAAAAPAAAPAEAPALAAWHGNWAGEGMAFGRPATATLEIGPAPDGATRLAYRLTVGGAPAYGAEGLYRLDAKGRVAGSWTDSTGRTRPVAGAVAADLWWTHWGSADIEIGRSTYALEAGGVLRVRDSVLQADGGWRLFAELSYRRTD
ncbi:MAG TPA: hypothetical protein PKD99_12250 [Sphingopyxis sp.]|nr:hypothetical protein [Sphingopyxis sp.]HMP45870.1 hypothetical protein [Sphingopyxis sp.]HMQ19270.1 hypothetical protein [Sphingopyxis sp.]